MKVTKFQVVRMLYQEDAEIENEEVIRIVSEFFNCLPMSMKALSVYKARLRAEGMFIPDKRLRKEK